ncbi:MAG: hypothetical protein ACXU9U_05805, partial [Parachlamydiaceae bacterium]
MNCLTSIPRCLQEFGFVAYEKVGEALTALVEAACRALAYIAETFANLPIWQEERQVQQQTENPFPQHVIPVAQQPKAIDTLQLNVNGTPEELEHSLSQVSEIAVRLQMVIQTSLKEIADAYEEKRMSLEKAIQKIDIIADDQSSQIITLPKFYEITLRVEIDWMSKCLNDYLGSLAKIQEGEVKTAQEKLKIKKEIDKCLTDCRQRFVDQNTDQWLIDDEDLIGKHEQVIESYNLVFSNPEVIQLESDLDEALAYLKKWEEGSQEKIEFAVTTTKMYAHAEIEVQVALQGKYEELISLLKDKHDFSVDD